MTFIDPNEVPFARRHIPHYYGDVERELLLFAGAVMLVGLFFFHQLLPSPMYLSLMAIMVLVVIAGAVSPRQKWLAVVNAAVAFIGGIIFSYEAFTTRAAAQAGYYPEVLPWMNLTLAIVFIFTLYFSVKTLRWRFSKGEGRLWDKRPVEARSLVS